MELDELQVETARLSNWAHLATVGADGNPDVVPVWPAWQDGVVWISSDTHSVKVRNLAANPNVAMHWQVDESGDGVEVWGTAKLGSDRARTVPSSHLGALRPGSRDCPRPEA